MASSLEHVWCSIRSLAVLLLPHENHQYIRSRPNTAKNSSESTHSHNGFGRISSSHGNVASVLVHVNSGKTINHRSIPILAPHRCRNCVHPLCDSRKFEHKAYQRRHQLSGLLLRVQWIFGRCSPRLHSMCHTFLERCFCGIRKSLHPASITSRFRKRHERPRWSTTLPPIRLDRDQPLLRSVGLFGHEPNSTLLQLARKCHAGYCHYTLDIDSWTRCDCLWCLVVERGQLEKTICKGSECQRQRYKGLSLIDKIL